MANQWKHQQSSGVRPELHSSRRKYRHISGERTRCAKWINLLPRRIQLQREQFSTTSHYAQSCRPQQHKPILRYRLMVGSHIEGHRDSHGESQSGGKYDFEAAIVPNKVARSAHVFHGTTSPSSLFQSSRKSMNFPGNAGCDRRSELLSLGCCLCKKARSLRSKGERCRKGNVFLPRSRRARVGPGGMRVQGETKAGSPCRFYK